MAAVFEILAFSMCVKRLKKPFNSILGETYEYVAEDFRAFAEWIERAEKAVGTPAGKLLGAIEPRES